MAFEHQVRLLRILHLPDVDIVVIRSGQGKLVVASGKSAALHRARIAESRAAELDAGGQVVRFVVQVVDDRIVSPSEAENTPATAIEAHAHGTSSARITGQGPVRTPEVPDGSAILCIGGGKDPPVGRIEGNGIERRPVGNQLGAGRLRTGRVVQSNLSVLAGCDEDPA